MLRVFHYLLLVWLLPQSLLAQSLAQRVRTAASGTVRVSFPARSGTCGDGDMGIRLREGNHEWQPNCGPQLVRVALRLSEHGFTPFEHM